MAYNNFTRFGRISRVYVLSNLGHHNWFVESLIPHFKTTFVKRAGVCVCELNIKRVVRRESIHKCLFSG